MVDPTVVSHSVPTLLLAGALGYLIGSVPFGLLLTRLAGLGDVRSIGSHNIGATNVLRTGRRDLAAYTLLLDALKGMVAVLIAAAIWGAVPAAAAGIGAFLGHVFPAWIGFKGGKGVATFLGVSLGLYWPAALVFAAVWIGIAVLFRFSSLAALTASVTVPLVMLIAGYEEWALMTLILTVILYLRHFGNIRRLPAGTESRIGNRA